MVSLQTTSQQTSSSAHAGWFPSIFLDQNNFILGGTPWRFFLHHYLFWCCNRIGKKYFNIVITINKLRIVSWLFLSVYFITAKFNRSFELDILYWYINAKQLWTRIIRFWKLCFKTLSSNVAAAFGAMRLVHHSFERYESKDWNEWWNVSHSFVV